MKSRASEALKSAEEMFKKISAGIENGDLDPLEVAVAFDSVRKAHDKLKDVLRDQITSSITEKEVSAYGATIIKKPGRTIYSYTHIPEWVKLNNLKTELEESAKAAAKMEASGRISMDVNTGEVIPSAVYRKAADSYIIKIEKDDSRLG